MAHININVGIPTYRRPQLLQYLLNKINEIELPTNVLLNIIVVDNDALRSAEVITAGGFVSRFPIKYICESRKGLAFVRNRILEAATGDYLVMIDDDQYPSPAWIRELVAVAEDENCDAVVGNVLEVFPQRMPPWLRQIHTKDTLGDRSKINGGSTANVLLRINSLRKLNLWFDPRFNTIGGEDTDFFERLCRLGGDIRFSAHGYVYAPIDESRISLRWYVKRNLRVGAANSIIFYEKKGLIYKVAVRTVRGAVGSIVLFFGILMFLLNNKVGFLLIQTGLRNIGHGLLLFGFVMHEYA